MRIQSSAFANVRHAAEGSDAEDFFDVIGNIVNYLRTEEPVIVAKTTDQR